MRNQKNTVLDIHWSHQWVAGLGFLNVHDEPGDPWRTDNVVAQLPHGAVVESKAEEGVWVHHDGGGWSIRLHDGQEKVQKTH